MLFHSSIRKELARTYTAIMAVLLTIVITVMLIRTLNMATKGSFSPQDVMIVLGLVMLGYIPIILSLNLFLCIVVVLTRMYRDSEMVIWQSAGAGIIRLGRTIFTFALPIIACIAVLILFAWPWSNRQITNIGLQFQQISDLSKIEPGKFQLFTNGSTMRVVFIEQQAGPKEQIQGKNVFLFNADFLSQKTALITASSAYTCQEGSDTFINLVNGQRLDHDGAQEMYTLSAFKKSATLVDEKQLNEYPAQKAREQATDELIANPTPANQGELFWRLGLILGSVNLVIWAIALGYMNPRQGRNINMLYALLLFIIYFNLLNLGRNWVSSGRLDFWLANVIIHGVPFLVALFFLLKQHNKWTFFSRARRSNSSKQKKENKTPNATVTVQALKKRKIKSRSGFFSMYTVRHLFYTEILFTVMWVVMGFVSLFFFFDFIENLGDMDKRGYKLHYVFIQTLLQVPAHLYELLPICVLIGSILVLARLAQNSEYTILRVSGLSPTRALKLLASVGLAGTLFTYILGNIIIPATNQAASQYSLKINQSSGKLYRNVNVIWLKDNDERFTYAVNASMPQENQLSSIFIYIFDKTDYRFISWIEAQSATINPKGWTLINATQYLPENFNLDGNQIKITPQEPSGEQPFIKTTFYPTLEWANHLNKQVVGISANKDTDLPLWTLTRYIRYLSDNAQDTSTFVFAMWQKIIYPFACIVMVMLALPFAYLHFRSGTISAKVFGGIMIGISFMIINSMFSHLGQLHHWPAIISVGAPSFIYLIISLSVFRWLVRNR